MDQRISEDRDSVDQEGLLKDTSLGITDGGLSLRREDVRTIFSTHISFGSIVTDCEPGTKTRKDCASIAVLRRTTNLLGSLPDYLREMAP